MPRYDHWEYRPAPAARAGSYRRQYGSTWWGRAFLEALEAADRSGRLSRGRTYANKGLVLKLEMVKPGRIEAAVQGSARKPYGMVIEWQPWYTTRVADTRESILNNLSLLGRLLAGKLPRDIVEVLAQHDLRLFPRSFEELNMYCDCPDFALPCKHQAAALYVLAGEIDNDPMRLFSLRGMDLAAALYKAGKPANRSGVPILASLLRPITTPHPVVWDDFVYQQLDFAVIPDAIGWKALNLLPPEPAFDPTGKLLPYLEKIYKRTARYASKLWSTTGNVDLRELQPTGTRLELHIDVDLLPTGLYAFDDEDEAQLEITDPAEILTWLTQLEQVEWSRLDHEARTLRLFFQLARKLAEAQAYLPQLLLADDEAYTLRYIPSTVSHEVRHLLRQCYLMASPILLYYSPSGEDDIQEFLPDEAPRQLLASLLGCILRSATGKLYDDMPARLLFLLEAPQSFTLVGTEAYPLTMHRWLRQAHLHERTIKPILRVTERQRTGMLDVDVLVVDGASDPEPFAEWYAAQSDSTALDMVEILGSMAEHYPDLDYYLTIKGKRAMRYDVEDFTSVLMQTLPTMRTLGVEVLLPKALEKILRPKVGLRVDMERELHELSGLISLDGILKFNWQASLGDQLMDEREFRKLLSETNGLVKIKENYVYVDAKEVAEILDKLDNESPDLQAHERLQALFAEEYEGAPVSLGDDLRQLIEQWRNAPPPEVPDSLLATLRPYQLRGYGWLYSNAQLGFGSIIADDMGLGKTLQVIAVLEKLRVDGELQEAKALVIVPTSLLGNWRREVEKFAPELRVHIYHGSQRTIPESNTYDILLTTYGVARTETAKLNKLGWRVQVIDESQAIKNPQAKQTRAIKKIEAPIRIAMSGTPVENKLLDYWSVMDFTLPRYLGSRKYFNEEFGRPIQGEHDRRAAERFRKVTAPFMLRRLKTDKSIIDDLPDKVMQTEYCSLVPEQAALYQSILDENLRRVREEEGISRQGLILKLITALKQCCNHPSQFLKRDKAEFGSSGKALLLKERLHQILDAGDKTLIFTQYREMGDLLVQMMHEEFGVAVPFLHGGSSPKQREAMVEQFQTSVDCPIFLLSIKAGGTGLNLTAANHVIHYDLWWNPAVENQATDRAYRIGQERTVFVHRLVTENTFEDKINQLIENKRQLADMSVGTGETWVGKLSNDQLGELVSLT